MGWLGASLSAEQGRLLPWGAVALAAGASVWFAWPVATLWASVVTGLLALIGAWAMTRRRSIWGVVLGGAVFALGAGFALVEIRSAMVAAPVLPFRYYGPIEGKVVGIDRSASDALRLTLGEPRLQRVDPSQLPRLVRISLHADQPHLQIEAGMRVMTTGHLAAPEGPIEPGGFDFQRFSWFRGIGAVGYTRTPVLEVAPASGTDVWVTRLRHHLSRAIQAQIAGEAGALAAAMMTGDRSGMGASAVEALRDSNLYHLVSISGVHMSLLAGFVYLGARSLLAVIPAVALRLPIHKIAAVLALGGAGFYLVLAGGDVATTRAFVMVAMMLCAILVDRRALSLRAIAMAAIVLIIWRPESVLDPGFQMSFAATAALVVGIGLVTPWLRGWPAFLRWPAFALLSSALAGFASAPFAALHFNRYAEYGLIANLVASPVMAIVMPAGVIAAALAPIGLAAPALWVMGLGCAALLWVAGEVASWEGALRYIAAPSGPVLPLLGLGFACLFLLRRWGRGVGLVLFGLVALLWMGSERPLVLIASDAGLVGVMGPEGRVLSRERGAGFTARGWLENDADPATQVIAAARAGPERVAGLASWTLGQERIAHLYGKAGAAHLGDICQGHTLVVISNVEGAHPQGCRVLDQRALAHQGAVALSVASDGSLVLRSTLSAHHPWVRARTKPRATREAWHTAAARAACDAPPCDPK